MKICIAPVGIRSALCFVFLVVTGLCGAFGSPNASAAPLLAGAAKVDITHRGVMHTNDPLHARALVLKSGGTTAVLVSLDVVAIEEIGPIKNGYLSTVRGAIQKELQITPANILVNASHCHGIVCEDVAERTIRAIKMAHENLEPVSVGVGTGHEDRIMENRRLKLKSGKVVDVRHAYSLPPDEEIAEVGPVDPEIGVLRLDNEKGETVAVVYNFAVHPIQGVPSGGNTADMTGFSSKVIEENLDDNTVALFLQGCGGDINPIRYKNTDAPRDAEPLGNLLGLSTLRAVRDIEPKETQTFKLINETIQLPRADYSERIQRLEAEQQRLVRSLGGTFLNLKSFLPLYMKYQLDPENPTYYAHHYLHEKKLGRNDFSRLDVDNRKHMQRYIQNIHVMEQLIRIQTNLRLLRKNHAKNVNAGSRTIATEVVGLRVGDFVLVTFPGELTVRIGLGIKERAPSPNTFVAGYTNGYIYYAPTEEQMRNTGAAQEDSDCILAPGWQEIFEQKVDNILARLQD